MISPLRAELELAKMVEGDPPAPIGVSPFALPAGVAPWAAIDGDRLLSSLSDSFDAEQQVRHVTDFTGALDAFIRIRDAADVLRFVARFGVLSLCEHGRSHRFGDGRGCPDCRDKLLNVGLCAPRQCDLRKRAKETGLRSRIKCGPETVTIVDYKAGPHGPQRVERRRRVRGCWNQHVFWEPLAAWLNWADLARTIIAIAAAVHRNRKPDAGDWSFLWRAFRTYAYAPASPAFSTEPVFTPKEGRWLTSAAVGWWLDDGDVRPTLSWGDGGPSVTFGGGVFGTLGLQLMRAVSRSHAVALCSGCGELYARPNRRPQSGRRNFCPQCGEKAGSRLRQQELRDRRREQAAWASERTEKGPSTCDPIVAGQHQCPSAEASGSTSSARRGGKSRAS